MNLMARLILILFGLAYLISPVDLIPDLALPFLGWIDDSLVLWCIYYLIRHGDLPWFMFKRPRQPNPAEQTRSGTRSRASGPRQSKEGAEARNSAGKTGPASPYEILGVDETASWQEIQHAYKDKIKQYHPDKLSHLGEEFSSLANEKFLEIQDAYDRIKARHRKK